MNLQQTVAIENHCRFAFETAHSRFRWLLKLEPGPAKNIVGSVILTVNSGYE